MDKIQSYRDLEVWQKSKNLVLEVYTATKDFPKEETYSLANQMQRAAISVPSNIAEGFYRNSKKEKLQFLHISFGSGAELETQVEISKDLGYLTEKRYISIVSELSQIMKMLNKIINTLSKDD